MCNIYIKQYIKYYHATLNHKNFEHMSFFSKVHLDNSVYSSFYDQNYFDYAF